MPAGSPGTTASRGRIVRARSAAASALPLQAAQATGTGHAVRLAVENATGAAVADEVVRVRSTGCALDCGPDDVYRVRAYETTSAVPRFNNSGTQVTVLALQNPTSHAIAGEVYFWSIR